MLYSTHAERENVRYFQNMLFAKLYSLPFLMKPNHLGQKSGSPPIFLTLSHHPFHVDHKVLPVSFLNIFKITPIFSILTVQDYITFSFRPLESLLRLHSASFSIPMPSTLYILASIALDFEYHQYTFWVYWLYDLVLQDSVFIPVSPLCMHCMCIYWNFCHWLNTTCSLTLRCSFCLWCICLYYSFCLQTLAYTSKLSSIKLFMFFSPPEFFYLSMFSQTPICLYLP